MISAMKKLALISSAVALALASPAWAEESAGAAQRGPALWKIADEDTTIYLFGTVHFLSEDVEWFDGAIKQAFDASDELITEVDITAAGGPGQSPPPQAFLPEGQTLRGLLNDEKRATYEAALAKLGIPPAALDRFEPWFATSALGTIIPVRNGYSANSGADVVLNRMAGDKQKDALETIDFQLAMFDGLTQEQQLAILERTARWVPLSGDTLDMMVSSWLAGDVGAVAVFLNWGMVDPEVRERLVTSRNASWAEWIDERLARPGTVFVAVGAGHLAGRGSLQEQLSTHGIEATRIQ